MSGHKEQFIETLRTRNHELISANHQLVELIAVLSDQSKEREAYISYLESVLNELGWTPGKSHSC